MPDQVGGPALTSGDSGGRAPHRMFAAGPLVRGARAQPPDEGMVWWPKLVTAWSLDPTTPEAFVTGRSGRPLGLRPFLGLTRPTGAQDGSDGKRTQNHDFLHHTDDVVPDTAQEPVLTADGREPPSV